MVGGKGRQRRPRVDAQLPEDVLEMCLHRLAADIEATSDLRVGTSRGHQDGDRLLAFGENSAEATKAFGGNAKHFTRIEDLLEDLQDALAPDVTVLVKGSRFMKMERVVNALEMTNGE